MGVRGIRHLLRDVGWLASSSSSSSEDDTNDRGTSNCGCSTSIWKKVNASDAFLGKDDSPSLEKIPQHSTFLIDGNGLAFYLHSIAYARYLRSLDTSTNGTHNNNNSSSSSDCCPLSRTVMSDQQLIVKALPCVLPLRLLREVTKEFVSELKNSDDSIKQIKVFWDGTMRRHKAGTDLKRRAFRKEQESNLEMFCKHGSIKKFKKNNRKSKHICELKDDFPFSKLFLTCVRHALQEDVQNPIVDMVECTEEADLELALEARGKEHTFICGLDSDFFFYKDINYIPLNQISIQTSGIHAFIARRSDLANLLGFDNDSRLVDLALLMGNDYVDSLSLDLPDEIELDNVQSIVFYLQCHEDFEVIAKNEEGKAAVKFVRSLYNFYNLEEFPLETSQPITNKNNIPMKNSTEARLLPQDMSVRDGLIRYLETNLDQIDSDSNSLFTSDELHAYKISSMPMKNLPTLLCRPTYQDMELASFIERCISRFYRTSSSLLIKATPPDALLNRIDFFSAIASLRENVTEKVDTRKSPAEERTPEKVEAVRRLPIDDHETEILDDIRNNRVTIIHGETGCGKSSRVPVMLLKSPPPDGSLRKVKFFISQPRRIAAKALVERVRSCEPDLKDKFSLRMGGGWKEYESKETQASFVTTGYLVRLLANHPEKFNEMTHLVIDEVHERSVDTDLLCLLSRRLLQTNKTIRLVLMSATLATKMYRDYFSVINEPIHVGVRTFPITEYFIEDLSQFGLPSQEAKAASAIRKEIESKKCVTAPKSAEISNRFALTARLATIVGEPGSSVLIFVPGMGEIVSITECIESFHMTGIRYTCFPIHGDIPFEEQMNAFNDPEEDEVKVIIATNAAESSVTLPAVDHVICLGLCKQIIYNQASHRQMLTPAWISRASATQRAGRTGRVRPGNVYRLYTRRAYENYMEEFEPGEMLRIPLDSVILLLKQILHEEVIPAFMDCLEPPPLDTISRSFQSLHHWGFITEADDKADITSLGSFVSSLGVDLSLGAFIGLGIQFGVAAEAIEMAAMMSLTKTPFQITSPMWLTPDEFNVNASQTYAAKCKFDAGLYSEPLALMNALWDYVIASNKNTWCYKNKIAATRWKQAVSSRNSIRKRVADFLGVNEDKLQVQLPPRDMPRQKLLFLRLLMVWVFSDSIIECAPSKLKLSHDDSVTLSIKGKSSATLKDTHLDRILQSERHPYNIIECNEVNQTGVFEEDGIFYLPHFLNDFDFEDRLISYASEKGIEAILCYSDEGIFLYLEETKMSNGMGTFLETVTYCSSKKDIFVYDYTNKKRRGLQERACGVWAVNANPQGDFARQKQFKRIDLIQEEVGNDFGRICSSMIHELYQCNLKSKMIWHFFTQRSSSKKKKKSNSVQPFFVTTIGECRKVSKPDLEDLLGRKPLSVSENVKNSAQSIVLKRPTVSQLPESRGLHQPLFLDVPEGARILAMLASSQRKGKYMLRIPKNNSDDPEDTMNFSMAQDEIDVSKRWRRLGTSNLVYVDESVPSTAIHTTNDLYAVAANSLELQQGGLRVDGLTLLPPNPLFILLSQLSFGLEPDTPLLWSTQSEEVGTEKKVHRSYSWLVDKVKMIKTRGGDQTCVSGNASADAWVLDRLRLATVFHQNSLSMGEKLACFPERISQLCALFDGVEGDITPWESIMEESLTMENLSVWRMERKTSTNTEYNGLRRTSVSDGTNKYSTPKKDSTPARKITPGRSKKSTPAKKSPPGRSKNRKTEINSPKDKTLEHHAIRHFDSQLINPSNLLFSTTLNNGATMPAFPSTNILALVFQTFEEQVLNIRSNNKSSFKVSLNTENWDVSWYKKKNTDDTLYKARFVNDSIGDMSVVGRGKNKLPKWIKKNSERPSTIADAKACVPPNVLCPKLVESDSDGLLFESIEEALQMEAAFWLNKQFCHAGKVDTRNWYAHSIDQMIHILQKQHDGSLEQMQEEYSSNF